METSKRKCIDCSTKFECLDEEAQWRCIPCQVEFRINNPLRDDKPSVKAARKYNRSKNKDSK